MQKRPRSYASCHFNGSAAGAAVMTRARGVHQVFRAGAGDYYIITPAHRNIRAAAGFSLTVKAIGAAARILQFADLGGGAPPGGANAPAGALAIHVLAFDAAGAAADADFQFEADRAA